MTYPVENSGMGHEFQTYGSGPSPGPLNAFAVSGTSPTMKASASATPSPAAVPSAVPSPSQADPQVASAADIGALYKRAAGIEARALQQSLPLYHQCGVELAKVKASLKHGEWLPWLREHAAVLGFKRITAHYLMTFANVQLAERLTPEQAKQESRRLWGHAAAGTTAKKSTKKTTTRQSDVDDDEWTLEEQKTRARMRKALDDAADADRERKGVSRQNGDDFLQTTNFAGLMSNLGGLIVLSELNSLYKAMASRLHPDKPTGDADQMRRLNIIVGRLREEYYDLEQL